MKPSDSNLSAEEYIKYYVTDENVIRHIEQLLSEIESLNADLCANEVDSERIYELEAELEDARYDIEQLKERNKFLEEEVCSLEDEIRFYEDDIIHMRQVIADLEHGKY